MNIAVKYIAGMPIPDWNLEATTIWVKVISNWAVYSMRHTDTQLYKILIL